PLQAQVAHTQNAHAFGYQAAHHEYGDGVHPIDHEGFGPALVPLHIGEPVAYAQAQHGHAASEEHVAAGPQGFVDGHDPAPEVAHAEQQEADHHESGGFGLAAIGFAQDSPGPYADEGGGYGRQGAQ